MFETSMVLAQPRRVRGRAGLLTVSIVAHTAAIVGAVAISVASTNFPVEAPNESAIFMPVAPPPPLGTPNGGGPKKPAATPPVQKQQQTTPPVPTQPTAPATIPNDTPVLDAPSNGDSNSDGPAGDPGPKGVPWGDEHGVGDPDAPPSPIAAQPVDEKVYTPGGEVIAPVLIHRVNPPFPEVMRRARINEATVVIKCIIDKNGQVRDPEIVKSAMPPFNDAVLNAITQWRYQPGSYRGNAVETWLYVTVHFGLK